ncbi:protein tesmin/TSO1-like CXC 3 isoform X2 [Diospyros lotus]|uniref:protein tesmin/TSO1-like CXC 3 isoform X2 n=1 Tax=Diospyros lotus TaxID=55363 RepID=UPI00225835D7|nr:protein tesmin/TSO1-like CXC 3 isoform X2 [Diospyros lotus]
MDEEGPKLDRESENEARGVEGPPMDTPVRKQITTPTSKFEDSPVFNYINSLSPIKMVKSIRISQTFTSLNFAPLPSIFTSPHANSLKESRFLKRHQLSDPSKPEFSSENENNVGGIERVMAVVNKSYEQESFDPASFIREACVEPTYDCSKLATEISQSLSHDCSGPDCASPCNTRCTMESAGTSETVVPYIQETLETGLVGSGVHLEGTSNIEKNKEQQGCDWESLISDGGDFLIVDSATGTEDTRMRPCTSLLSEFMSDEVNDLQTTQCEAENPFSRIREKVQMKEAMETGESHASSSLHKLMDGEPSEQTDIEPLSSSHYGIRRRCLVFEMTGACIKHLDYSSSSASSMLQSYVNVESNDKNLESVKPGNDSSSCILPGIGLHLNALARNSEDYSIVSHETSAPGPFINDPAPTVSFHSLPSGQELLNISLAATSTGTNLGPAENGVQGIEDASQAFNQSSPKNKRHVLENAGEGEGCKRCNCKKSKCLKLYCECFAAGVYCVEPCSCQDCFNKLIHEDTVLATRKQIESRNPLAFAPKVIRSFDSIPESGDDSSSTPASARHKRGCNCKKSGCLKKYCECYQGGVGCSITCRCEGCKNVFGRKDEAELKEHSQEQNPDSTPPSAPPRPPVQLPFPSTSKPPRSSLSIRSISGIYGSQRYGKPNFLKPQPKFENRIQAVQEAETPDILRGNSSSSCGIKSVSPNRKRVSPPHCDSGSSSGRKSSRKLILRSIPSFPSLTPKD